MGGVGQHNALYPLSLRVHSACLEMSHFPVDKAADCALCRPRRGFRRTLAADMSVYAPCFLAAVCHTIEIQSKTSQHRAIGMQT